MDNKENVIAYIVKACPTLLNREVVALANQIDALYLDTPANLKCIVCGGEMSVCLTEKDIAEEAKKPAVKEGRRQIIANIKKHYDEMYSTSPSSVASGLEIGVCIPAGTLYKYFKEIGKPLKGTPQ